MAEIVVIEDEADISMLVETTLTFGGHHVHIAANGREGIELVAKHQPELVLLDVQMPDMSGYDVLQAARNDPKLRHIPMFLFSANSRSEDIQRGLDLGAAGFLSKPFDPGELLQQINRALEKHAAAAEGLTSEELQTSEESGTTVRTI